MEIKNKYLTYLILLSLGFSSCQSAKELHYFKSEGNYYRLKINEYSFASKSRYLSGFFSDRALELYFSEMSQPDSCNTVQWIQNSQDDAKNNLVMILSTNSNSISEQIGGFASNEQTLETIARLANKDKIEKSNAISGQLQEAKELENKIRKLATNYLDSLDKSDDPEGNLKNFVTSLEAICDGKLNLKQLSNLKSNLKIQ
jgi:hypothetical protein